MTHPQFPVRLGLCCQFIEQPIRFRTTTVANLRRLPRNQQLQRLSQIIMHNAEALEQAIAYCAANEIGCFRILSQILPVVTHPELGYRIEELPDGAAIESKFRACREHATAKGIRTVFHPDPFVVLSSPRDDVVSRSLADLEYHAQIADWVGADVINIHAGGAYGDKQAALKRFAANLDRLSYGVRSRLTVENDDSIYSLVDLWPWCRRHAVPLVLDIHHDRCLPCGWSLAESTSRAMETWDREPLFHVSSPLNGWNGPHPERHHDYIDVEDFPEMWWHLPVTVEIEAKAKELAIGRLKDSVRWKIAKNVEMHESKFDTSAKAPCEVGR